tara:strand:- start:1102 stop:1410 length:309 start_codon:yes stop_codon:yes gene_type:complete
MEAIMTTEWKKDLPAVLGCDDAIGNDAEILIHSDGSLWNHDENDKNELKQLARLAFTNYNDINDEFVKRIIDIAKVLKDAYSYHDDQYVHVQVRFNFNYCNM